MANTSVGGASSASEEDDVLFDLTTRSRPKPLPKRQKTVASTSKPRGRTTTSKTRDRTTRAEVLQPIAAEEVEEEQSNGYFSVALADPDLLNCPICCELLCSPVCQCENGHISCASCSTTRLKNKCAVCSLHIGSTRWGDIEKFVESVRVGCQYNLYGCPEMISYRKKLDHEKACNYFPCSCPCCEFVGTSKCLYDHFGLKHKDSSKLFYLYRVTPISMDNTKKHVILREGEEGVVFVLNRCTETLGSFYNVLCVAQSASKRRFSYELTATNEEDLIKVQSSVEIMLNWTAQPPKKVSLLVPSNFISTGQVLKLCLVIREKYDKIGAMQ